jgi:hypothetical protein
MSKVGVSLQHVCKKKGAYSQADCSTPNSQSQIFDADGCCQYSGPSPQTSLGNKYVLVTVDYFSKWVEAYAIPNQETETIARN